MSWNLGTRGQATPWIAWQLDATHLLDKAYREHGSGIDAPARGIGLGVDLRL